MQCPLCIEYVQSSVACPFCRYATCRPCAQKYIRTCSAEGTRPRCMDPACRRDWSAGFLCEQQISVPLVLAETARTLRTIPPRASALVGPCTREGCTGVVATVSYRCKKCTGTVCRRCEGTIRTDATHACSINDVLSVAFLKKDTKPCPNCAVPIHRTSGCDYMWCTHCRTPFSWKKGRQDTHLFFHNPHAPRDGSFWKMVLVAFLVWFWFSADTI